MMCARVKIVGPKLDASNTTHDQICGSMIPIVTLAHIHWVLHSGNLTSLSSREHSATNGNQCMMFHRVKTYMFFPIISFHLQWISQVVTPHIKPTCVANNGGYGLSGRQSLPSRVQGAKRVHHFGRVILKVHAI